MIRARDDNRTIRLDSILLILILFFGLQIFQNKDYNKSVPNGRSILIEISISQRDVIVSTGIEFHYFQKSWISNRDNLRLLSFEKSQLIDNKKVNQKIFLLDKIRKKSTGFLIPFYHYHLFPQESDELPVLS